MRFTEAEVNSMLEAIFWDHHTGALLYDLWLTNIAESKKFTIAPVFDAIMQTLQKVPGQIVKYIARIRQHPA